MPCNSGQYREQKTPCLRGICKPLQRPATTDRKLVAGAGVSGSSPLVGSPKSAVLQVKREVSQSSRASLYRNRTATRQPMAYSRPPRMPCQALKKGCAFASRHLGEQRTQGRLRCYSVLLREARRTSRLVAIPPTGTLSFLFTDIEGSTKLWEHDAPAMQLLLARHDEILRSAMDERGGYVFKTFGDAFCCAFSTAPDAVEAALEAQRTLLGEEWEGTGPLRVRMALHTGAAEERDGDYFGPPVNRVARLLSATHGGQVLL